MLTSRFGLLLSCAGLVLATGAGAQSRYHGTAQPAAGGRAIPIVWSIFSHHDTVATGWMEVDTALGGPALATAFTHSSDSVMMISMSSRGDTIAWLSSTHGPAMSGNYKVLDGANAGQTGTWSLEQEPDAARGPIVAAILIAACGVVGLLLLVAGRLQEGWWRKRLAKPLVGVSDEQRQKWSKGIGGWLAWFVLANSITCIVLLFGLQGVGENIGAGMWLLGGALPSLRSTFLVEGLTQAIQPIGALVGLVLVARKSRAAPVYWMLFMTVLGLYVLFDYFAVDGLQKEVTSLLGSGAGFMDNAGVQRATTSNMRLLLGCLVWGSYWSSSKRVRLRFGPPESSSAGGSDGGGVALPPSAGLGSSDPQRTPSGG